MPRILSDDRDIVKLRLGQKLRQMQEESPEDLKKLLMGLSPDEAMEIQYDQEVWLRENQWIDISENNPATIILALAGRGFGKTYTGAATVKRAVEKHGVKKMLITAYTSRDIRATLVPAIIGMYPPGHKNTPKWRPGEATMVWPNGAEAICIPSEAGEDAPRGLNTELILSDEMASYGNNEGIIHQALLTLRHAPSKLIIMTTPKATPLLIEYTQRAKENDPNIQLITGSTYDNKANLSKAFMEGVVSKYEGTHLAQAELHGQLILSNPSALWQMTTIERNLVTEKELPPMEKYSLGVDPALLSKKSTVGKRTGRTPDSCGIVLAGQSDDIVYTLDNFTGSYNPEQMVLRVCAIHDLYAPIAPIEITVEVNNLGEETLKMMFKSIDRLDVFKKVKPYFSTLSKLGRAQPYALIAQQDKIKYVNKSSMSQVFTELTSYTGDGTSPGALDASVFAWNNLKPTRNSFTHSYELVL